jgi:release factor glutamine methyltransferase
VQTIVDRLRAAGCVYAEDEAAVLVAATDDPAALDRLVDQRVAGLPLEHVLGWADFHGRRVIVEPGVFVPRRRSELLVDEAAALLRPRTIVVDMCCGSGAVGAVLATIVDGIELHSTDIEPASVRCAAKNVGPVGGAVYEGDLFDALPHELRGRVGVIVANAPYVPTAEIDMLPREARDHEPLISLDGGLDGLAVQRRVIVGAPDWLAPDGHLLIETSAAQSPVTFDLFIASGFDARVASSEDLNATVVIGGLSPRGRR